PRADPHQQHQSDPGRGFARTRDPDQPSHRGVVRRHGDRAVSAARDLPEDRPEDRQAPWPADVFEQKLREQGRAYHIYHPFNVMLNTGAATREQIQGWVANRYYYQINIPRKDAAILANCSDREVRRKWIERILDHDGHGDDPGGIE